MKQTKLLSLLLALLMLLSLAACTPAAAPAAVEQTAETESPALSEVPAAEAPAAEAEAPAAEPEAPEAAEQPAESEPVEQPAAEAEAVNLTITVTVGNVTETLAVATTEQTLGAALLKEGLISGSDSEYGLFVDTVNGHFADSAKNEYWVFTKGGEWVTTGVDSTPIADGESYEWSIYGAEADPSADKTIRLTVTFDGKDEILDVKTGEETLGAALLKEGLISGSDSEYGLFVDTVNGHIADSAKNEYWVFTKGGEWVTTGVDSTPIADGDAFEWYIYQ